MAIRNIVKLGDDVLRKVCRTQMTFDEKLATTLDDMAETMYKAEGVGLAAPQIGILRRYCVVDVGDGIIELVNPVIESMSGEQTGEEGCLSIPNRYESVTRPMTVTVIGLVTLSYLLGMERHPSSPVCSPLILSITGFTSSIMPSPTSTTQ